MSRPTRQQVHPIDQMLTNLAIGFSNAPGSNFARKIFPVVPVVDQSGKYPIFSKDDILRDDAKRRAPGTAAMETGYDLSSGSYFCEEWALAHKLPIEIRRNMQGALDGDKAAVKLLASKMLIREDMLWIDAFFKAGVWTTDLAGVSGSPSAGEFKQFDASGSDPVGVIRTAIRTMGPLIGRKPNVLVMGPLVWDALQDHADLLARLGSNGNQIVGADLLKVLFGLEEVYVAESIRNTAAQGATFSGSYNMGKHMLLAYRAPTPPSSIMDLEPTAGAIMSWAEMDGMASAAASGAPTIETWWDDTVRSDYYRARSHMDMKVLCPDAGYFFEDAVS